MLENFKSSWLVPAIIVLVLFLVVIKKSHFSLTDAVAEKVIFKLNADYSPFGPTPPVN